MIKPEEYKALIDKYYLIGYKWKNDIEKMLSIPNKQFMKFVNTNVRTLETIDVSVAYPHFKIITLNFYLLPPDNPDNNPDNNIDDNHGILNYINNEANKDKISNISIKIVENDKIFTISDDKFNIYGLNDTIQIENKYYNFKKIIGIKKLISNFIEKAIE